MTQAQLSFSASHSMPSPRTGAWSFALQRLSVAALLFAPAMRGVSQAPAAPPEGSNWRHVQALPAGANVRVKAQHSSATCKLKSVDPDSLTCTKNKDLVFQRTEIRSITIPRRGRSALVGAAVGGGAGAIAGFATGTSGNGFFGPNFLRGPITAAAAVAFGAIGAGLGAATDFAHSTVYEAPAR